MRAVRVLGLLLIAGGAVAVWFQMATDELTQAEGFRVGSVTYQAVIDDIIDTGELNEARADTAPQQQVVNGWITNDFLELLAVQNVDLLEGLGALGEQNEAVSSAVAVRDDRVPALLALGVLAICLIGFTAESPVRPAQSPAMAAVAERASQKPSVAEGTGRLDETPPPGTPESEAPKPHTTT